jgi:predicted ATPase
VKIKIESLGKIRQAELDLRPITLLVGENNTNKSWTAYAIYALLRAMSASGIGEESHARVVNRLILAKIRALASQGARRIAKSPGAASINLEFSRHTIIQPLTGDLNLSLGGNELAKVLAVPPQALKASQVSLAVPRRVLAEGAERFLLSRMSDGGIVYGSLPGRRRKKLPQVMDLDHLDVFFDASNGQGNFSIDYPSMEYGDWKERIRNLLIAFTVEVFNTVFALPAERKALVSLYKAFTETPKIQLPLPLVHFLANLWQADSRAREIKGRSFAGSRAYSSLHSRLLNVLGGRLKWEGTGEAKRLAFSPNTRVSLPIQASSSMVRSLAGFAIAIEQFGPGRNVLVIDEPEMNAHPAAQLAIVEIIATLANLGNYVIATTHSPYVVDHFNNLLAADELEKSKRGRAQAKFIFRSDKSFLSADKVSAYELSDKGIVKDLVDRQRSRIATTTFGDVSSKLENLYNDILILKS